ncbi:hypothetical protein LTR36_000668 [Oleoguttula mirabilis]|uniref:AB hydrolase-1 domain-containing protein n=1 Tax=Oleoguttula mirabilis TaxID=1507867 RepID=A0AAV9JRR6_9PEZI|nr:hypothetical protein LTR36_000668 [Oleoguttula mirabilis]
MESLQEKHLDTSRGLHYKYYVSPESDASKPTLLLLHGWPDSAHLWQYVVPHLTSLRCKLVVPDLLGYGGTSKPTSPELYNYRRMSEDVAEILDAEKSGRVIPVGHDWGCYLASRFHLVYPERCPAAVHIGIAYLPPVPQHLDLDTVNEHSVQAVGYPRFEYWNLFSSPEAPRMFSEHLDSVWHALHGDAQDWMKQMFCAPDAMKNFLLQGRTDVPLRAYAQDAKLKEHWKQNMTDASSWESAFCWYHSLLQDVQMEEDKNIPEGMYKLDMPVLFIACDGDAVNSPELIDFPKEAGLLPDLRVEVLHSGHWCPYEKPEEIAGLLSDFLSDRQLVL